MKGEATMIKRAFKAALVSAAFLAGGAQAQIATVDLQSIMQLKQQYETMQSQLEKQMKQLDAVTGTSGMGAIGGNSAFDAAQKFPEQWDQVYGTNNAYESNAEQTLGQLDQQTDGMGIAEAQEYTRERVRLKNAHDRAVMQKIYDDNMEEMDNLSELQQEIETAQTQKEIEDLQARINVSQGTINAQQMRMQNMVSLQDAQQRMYEDQRRRAFMRKMVGDENDQSPSILP